MDMQQGVQLGDLFKLVRRRLVLMGTIAGAVVLAAIVVASVLPNRYEAWTTLLVEPQTISKRLVEAGLEESDLNSRLHLMTMQILSRGRLSRIIDDLTLYEEESKSMTREEVIQMMRDEIRVEPVLPELEQGMRRKESVINTFRLFYRSDKADTAAAVANRLANDFIEEHIKERVQISGDTSEFIDSQRESLTGQIAEVERRIAAVKAANTGRLPEDMGSNQRILERSTDNLRQLQRDLAIAESDESFYKQQALLGGESPNNASSQVSPAYRLGLLELQLNELYSRGFTEKHPDVVNTREEIDALRAQVAAGGEEDAEPENLSPAQQNAQAEAKRAALRAASTRQEIARLEAQIAEVEERIAATPRVSEQLAALEREYQHLYASYQEFSGKRLEAGVAAGMERRQKGEQFRVLETAFPPPSPTSPNRTLIVALGLMLGLALGGAVGLLLEASDSSFHDGRSLQGAVRVPVLASIPNILLESDRSAMRRRRLFQAVAAAAIVGMVLVGAVAGNWYVNGVPGPVKTILEGGGSETAALLQDRG